MTPVEAQSAIGYTYLSSVINDLRTGKLQRRRSGAIDDASVARRKAARQRSAARTALFLTDSADLSAEQRRTLSERPKVKA